MLTRINDKKQITNYKSQIITNDQRTKSQTETVISEYDPTVAIGFGHCGFEFGICLLFGACHLIIII